MGRDDVRAGARSLFAVPRDIAQRKWLPYAREAGPGGDQVATTPSLTVRSFQVACLCASRLRSGRACERTRSFRIDGCVANGWEAARRGGRFPRAARDVPASRRSLPHRRHSVNQLVSNRGRTQTQPRNVSAGAMRSQFGLQRHARSHKNSPRLDMDVRRVWHLVDRTGPLLRCFATPPAAGRPALHGYHPRTDSRRPCRETLTPCRLIPPTARHPCGTKAWAEA